MTNIRNRLPRLSRRGKLARNLAFVLLPALLPPPLLGWPSLTLEGAFRKLEGQYLLAPSQVVLETGEGDLRGYLALGETWAAVGQVQKFQSTNTPFERDVPSITQVLDLREPGLAVIPARDRDGATVAAAFGAPEEARQAVLTLTVPAVQPDYGLPGTVEEETFTARAQREGSGFYIFRLTPHDHGPGRYCALEAAWMELLSLGDELSGSSYTLKWQDDRGEELLCLSGELPESLHLRSR